MESSTHRRATLGELDYGRIRRKERSWILKMESSSYHRAALGELEHSKLLYRKSPQVITS